MKKLRVLCLDIEGGYGGSSRSLFESVKAISERQDNVEIEVWCKKKGPIQERYARLNVKTEVHPLLPKITSVERPSRNLFQYLMFGCDTIRAGEFLRRLEKAAQSFDIIHLNHESLHHLAKWLGKRTRAGISMHIRTQPPVSLFSRLQAKRVDACVDRLVYITENEQRHWSNLNPEIKQGTVIYNIVRPPENLSPLPSIRDGFLRVCCVSNYSWMRGLDRLVEIAVELKRQNNPSVRFTVAGNMSLSNSLPGLLGEISRKGGDLSDYAKAMGVEAYFDFPGHIPDPEQILRNSHILIKPTREANPWGRDILEALQYGRPAISFGTYDKFIETGKTGFLFEDFDAKELADLLTGLQNDEQRLSSLSRTAATRIEKLCNSEKQGRKLLEVWKELAAGKCVR
ncbi:glycosyltransferase family 4 protein [Kiloniella sp. b19]|uniref:glycosyltransferase family 4 protein n=1 Tax=Kiloniella sp. GXU_MW_B19 TaxID=3141326 RepID=UPI0031E17D1C